MNNQDVMLKIRVTNLDSDVEYTHNRVPLDHVEILNLSPNLKIEVLGQSRAQREDEYEADNSI